MRASRRNKMVQTQSNDYPESFSIWCDRCDVFMINERVSEIEGVTAKCPTCINGLRMPPGSSGENRTADGVVSGVFKVDPILRHLFGRGAVMTTTGLDSNTFTGSPFRLTQMKNRVALEALNGNAERAEMILREMVNERDVGLKAVADALLPMIGEFADEFDADTPEGRRRIEHVVGDLVRMGGEYPPEADIGAWTLRIHGVGDDVNFTWVDQSSAKIARLEKERDYLSSLVKQQAVANDDIKAENTRLADDLRKEIATSGRIGAELHDAKLLLATIQGRKGSILDGLTRVRPRVKDVGQAEMDDITSRVAHILDDD
jgi:hypothetical protein